MMNKVKQVKYKKAPQAPRRFKSSYMFFSIEKHKTIRKELEEQDELKNISTTDVAKMVSKAWKNLSTDKREEWEEMARRDKARFEMEKSRYTGPWKILAKKRSSKDPNAPKRPMSAFLSFSNSKRAQVKRENQDMGNTELSRLLAQMWKDASEEEKREHTEREYDLRQKYKVKIAEWRKNSESEVDAARMARENEAMEAVFASKLEGGSSSGAPLNENHHTHTDPSPYSSPRRATAHVPPGGYAYPQQPYGYGGYEQYGYNGPEDRVPLPADPGYPYAHYYDRGTSYGAYGQQYGPSDQPEYPPRGTSYGAYGQQYGPSDQSEYPPQDTSALYNRAYYPGDPHASYTPSYDHSSAYANGAPVHHPPP